MTDCIVELFSENKRVSLVSTCGNSRRTGFDFYDGNSCVRIQSRISDSVYFKFLLGLKSEFHCRSWIYVTSHTVCTCVYERGRALGCFVRIHPKAVTWALLYCHTVISGCSFKAASEIAMMF